MGTACARMFSESGDCVIGLDREGTAVPDGVRFLPIDVTDPGAADRMAAALSKEEVRLDAICYMAGVYDTDSLIEIDEQRMRRIFEVNVFGAYRAIKAFYEA